MESRHPSEWRFVLTLKCNFACCFCMKEYCPSAHSAQLLGPADYGRLASVGFERFGVGSVTLTGGEPLLRADVGSILRAVRSAGVHATLVTNGSLLEDRLRELEQLDELHVSFHSWSERRWREITGSESAGPTEVARGIRTVRQTYPDLVIKLNVVGDRFNGQTDSVARFLDFARENRLHVNVFQEGYIKWAKQMGVDCDVNVDEFRLWDPAPNDWRLVSSSPSRRTYGAGGASVSLGLTSADLPRRESVWVAPNGIGYSDVYWRGDAVDLTRGLGSRTAGDVVPLLAHLIQRGPSDVD